MKPFFILLIVIGASLHSNAIAAQNSSKLRADRIQISYVPPKDAAHEPVFRLLKERQVLEQFRELLSPLRLPRALRLKLKDATGYPTPGMRMTPSRCATNTFPTS